jgi:hypothetical protein
MQKVKIGKEQFIMEHNRVKPMNNNIDNNYSFNNQDHESGSSGSSGNMNISNSSGGG